MSRTLAYVVEAAIAIWRNRTRSLLTVIGMVIGIAAVIAILGLSKAASGGIKSQIASGGDPGFVAYADPSQNDPTIATLQYRDAAMVANLASAYVSRAVPFYSASNQGFQVRVGAIKDYLGANSTSGETGGAKLIEGRRLTSDDILSGARVVDITKGAATKLFPNASAVGQTLNLGRARVQIVGVIDYSGSLIQQLNGDTIIIPYTTFHNIAPGPIDYVQYWINDQSQSVPAIAAVKGALAHLHGSKAQYIVLDQAQFAGSFGKILDVMGVALTFIGGIALLVAGINIMNIMLVSVTERTREIGLRKAIGASPSDISLQFLIEAVLLSLCGGLIGMLFGILAVIPGAGYIRSSFGSAPVPYVLVISIAVGFSAIVGVGFGWYPAVRASKLDPIEALRS
ncbi:MAG: ABC transporter permease [Candidatus Eremiobacteraeota bacterium]|nr:ABC transporter permease [Candidatus Eremiobacteraeota bacterium]